MLNIWDDKGIKVKIAKLIKEKKIYRKKRKEKKLKW